MDKEELKQIYASIHTLRVEGDFVAAVYVYDDELFQSTPSAWRVTGASQSHVQAIKFQSTPSAWRVT